MIKYGHWFMHFRNLYLYEVNTSWGKSVKGYEENNLIGAVMTMPIAWMFV